MVNKIKISKQGNKYIGLKSKPDTLKYECSICKKISPNNTSLYFEPYIICLDCMRNKDKDVEKLLSKLNTGGKTNEERKNET